MANFVFACGGRVASLFAVITDFSRLARGNQNFRRLWFAQIVSEIGDWFYAVAIYSLLLELTGKASSLGIALVLQVLPQTFVGPLAGIVNDRISRKKIMIAADLARAVIVASMLLVRSRSSVWLVYPLLLLETIMWAFFEPARTAVLPSIAPEKDLVVANTLSSATWSANFAIGSLLGGLAAAFLGRNAVFVINALTFFGSAWLIHGMSFREPHMERAQPLHWRSLADYSPVVEGIRYLRSDARLLAAMVAKTGIGIMGASWVILPIMGEQVFPLAGHGLAANRAGMLSMSLLMAARGMGSMLGPVIATSWAGQNQHRLRVLVTSGLVVGAVGYMILSRMPSLGLACSAVILAHAGGANIWVSSTTLLQLNTQDCFRGRVFSTDLGVAMFTMAISCYTAGRLVDAGIAIRTVAFMVGVTMVLPISAWVRVIGSWGTLPPAAIGE